jgi:recombination protein RecT
MATAATAEKAEKKSAPKGDALAIVRRDVVDVVAARVQQLCQDGELHMPEGYSPQNAMKAAWLALQEVKDRNDNPALTVCTQNSIANALLDMAVQGLNPAKQQCYFIVYGKTLVCQRSYLGTVALLRRVFGTNTEVYAEVVYEADEFEYEIRRGNKHVTKHVQKLENIDSKRIVAAYAVIEIAGREPYTELMTFGQIQRAWEQGQTKGKSPAHIGFPDAMAKKSVINRACKVLVKSSDDSYLLRAIERSEIGSAEAELASEAAENANREVIEFPDRQARAALPEGERTIDDPTDGEEEAVEVGVTEGAGPGF